MPNPITLESALDKLVVDPDTGRLLSLRAKAEPDVELLAGSPDDPVFVLQYIDEEGQYRSVSSVDAVGFQCLLADGDFLSVTYVELGGLELHLRLSIGTSSEESTFDFGAIVFNRTGLRIVDVQYPFVVVPQNGQFLLPVGHGGRLANPAHLPTDEPTGWQIIPENGNSPHYPGRVFAQFLAQCSEPSGVYLACDDTAGNVKLLQAVRRESGVRLGVAHVGDWPANGKRVLGYHMHLRSFQGDWHDAADIYRDWALQQTWATPLTKREDIPEWLLDSPPHITIRLQGYIDDGPAPPVEEFLPYEKCLPLLQGISDAVNAPLVAVMMSWEHGGPWVYPDCFPPVGGEESIRAFIAEARERGWHVGSFCNGTRWVLKHLFNGYDGTAYYEANRGERTVCRQADGEPWREYWDQNWRPSLCGCMAQAETHRIARRFVERLVRWGMESIQFFDQNCNAATFPCFAYDHGHPPAPGKWMAAAMADITREFPILTRDQTEVAPPPKDSNFPELPEGLQVAYSTENPCNEFCLPLFTQSDCRISVPSSGEGDYVPLYHYLYHECTILHGMMSIGPDPYAIETRTAWGGVWGQIPGAVLCGDGTLLNRETYNWAEWEPKVGSNANALAMIRSVTAMRRGAGRDFLVFGRMERPAGVETEVIRWTHGRDREVPAVAHAAWRSPGGQLAVVLANWTDQPRRATVTDPRLEGPAELHTWPDGAAEAWLGGEVIVPALGCALLVGSAPPPPPGAGQGEGRPPGRQDPSPGG